MKVSTAESPLLDLPGAVGATGVDAGTAWHYGDPLGEQRVLASGAGLIDRSNRPVVVVSGVDRLGWLHSICSQHVSQLAEGASTSALVLSPHGHVEQDWRLSELGGQVWIDAEPGHGDDAMAYLQKMIFMKRVEPVDVSAGLALLSLLGTTAAPILVTAGYPVPTVPRTALSGPDGGFVRAVEGGFDLMVARSALRGVARELIAAGATPVGAWAAEARRVERREPRLGLETDHRTIPHEIGLIGVSVHLDKGCYRGQETVARVQNLGRPPRRLVLLHLSGEREELPEPGTPVQSDARPVGFLGTAVHHHELGPIALAVVKRNLTDDAPLEVGGHTAAIDRG